MVKCSSCGQEMQTAESCKDTHVLIGKSWHKRLTGSDGFSEAGQRCHDCGILVKVGNYHHFGCDAERCPKCERQLLSCDCDVRTVGKIKR